MVMAYGLKPKYRIAGHYHTFWLEGQEAFWDQVQLLARRVNGLQGQTRAHWHLMYTMADLGDFFLKNIRDNYI